MSFLIRNSKIIRWYLCILLAVFINKISAQQNDSCTWDLVTPVKYLSAITCPDDFAVLGSYNFKQGHTIGSIKVSYDFTSKKMYFITTSEFDTHYDFCKEVLNYAGDHQKYNETEYKIKQSRKYYNFILSYYKDLEIYTFEFFRNDQISYTNILEVYDALTKTVFFPSKLYFLPTTFGFDPDLLDKSIPVIEFKDLFTSSYEALNTGTAYGILRNEGNKYFQLLGQHDIVILDELVNDLPIVAGVITTEYQPTLSHINVLSRNRGTPNMVLSNPMDNKYIVEFIDSLICLKVYKDSFSIRLATIEEAEKFWNSRNHKPQSLPYSVETPGLVDMKDIDCKSVNIAGSKAANFAELSKIVFDEVDSAGIPENAFAIPFYYYEQYIRSNKIDKDIQSLLENNAILSNKDSLQKTLALIQQKILKGTLDSAFVTLVKNRILSFGDTIIPYKFRSSSNSEDLEFFNGAGLYESKTGTIGSSKKPVEKAIKEVWASLWNYRAFEERKFFNIQQETAKMGVLVHRAFPDEKANGVAVTADIFDNTQSGAYINVQVNEASIVLPDNNEKCDEILVTYAKKKNKIKYLSNSTIYKGDGNILFDREIDRLCHVLEKIKQHYYTKLKIQIPYNKFAMDVEFKLDKAERIIYIKQARRYPMSD